MTSLANMLVTNFITSGSLLVSLGMNVKRCFPQGQSRANTDALQESGVAWVTFVAVSDMNGDSQLLK